MLISRLAFLLPYEVKMLQASDAEAILILQKGHPNYHTYLLDHPVTKADILTDLTSLPDRSRAADKFYLGFYQDKKLIALVDIVLSFPDNLSAWLGLIMVDQALVKQGIGQTIIKALKHALKREGFKQLLAAPFLDEAMQNFFAQAGFEVQGKILLGNKADGTPVVGLLQQTSLAD